MAAFSIAVTSLPSAPVGELLAGGMKMGLDTITAFGTVGAVGVALWISLKDGARRRHEALLHARIEAMRINLRLESLVKRTFEIADWYNGQLNGEATTQTIHDMVRRLEDARGMWGAVDLNALIPLGSDCAANLAAWLGGIEYHIRLQQANSGRWLEGGVEELVEFIRFSHGSIRALAIQLQNGWMECQNAAHAIGPYVNLRPKE